MDRLIQLYGRSEAAAIRDLVMETLFSFTRTDVLLGRAESLSVADRARVDAVYEQLRQGVPVQYALGEAWFLSRRFHVTPAVLIPRPETEELVRLLLSRLDGHVGAEGLDLCTGSGCIAVSLALSGFSVMATDVSEEALAVARDNARRLGARVTFVREDVLADDVAAHYAPTSLDFVVSNPPYVCEREKAEMSPHVLQHEPSIALFVPDSEPLRFYRPVARVAAKVLRPGGVLAVEVNREYAEEVATLFENHGFTDVSVYEDQFHNPRFVFAAAPDVVCPQ